MPDREKVMKALEWCIKKPCHPNCPYFTVEDESQARCLFTKILPDALALLKEQEAVAPEIVMEQGYPYTMWYVCADCRKAIDPGDKFCRNCGREITLEPTKEEEDV